MIAKATIEHYIKKYITPIKSTHKYLGETAINPAYESISHTPTMLAEGEIRIWALREDLILATGIKNAYQSKFGYHGLKTTFPISLHRYIDWNDRYGHPSLAISEKGTVGVYLAGYVKREAGVIKIFLASGRYFREDLSLKDFRILEHYIANLFILAYGDKKVKIYHGLKAYRCYDSDESYYKHLGRFFNKADPLTQEPYREYQARSHL